MDETLPLDLPALAKVTSPFSEDQLASLDAYQQSATEHPYTCPLEHPWCDDADAGHPLRCWIDPMECICTGCGYTQDWAWAYTADWSWKHKRHERITEAEYLASLPGRAQKIADHLSEGLPAGYRLEWSTPEVTE